MHFVTHPPGNSGFSGKGLIECVGEDSIDTLHTFALEGKAKELRERYWIALKNGEGEITAEGTLSIPQEASRKLALFVPGMPGAGSLEAAEEKFTIPLLQAHYITLVLRHLGAWIDTKTASTFIHCEERIALGKEQKEHTLGDERPYNIQELASSVSTAVNALGQHFEDIHLIGHSSGALGILWSLPKIDKDIRSRIRQIISLAGFTGGIENLRWPLRKTFGLRAYFKRCQNALNLVSPTENIKHLREMFRDIYASTVPDNIMVIQVHTPWDEFILPRSALRLQEHLGRGLTIFDKTEYQKGYHHLRNLQSETLLRLLELYHPSLAHVRTLERREPKRPPRARRGLRKK